MGKRKMLGSERRMEFAAGVFFFGALILLGIFTIVINKDGGLFSKTYERRAVFDNIGSINAGDRVLLRGMEVGTIGEASLTEDANQVRLILKLNRPIDIHEDYLIEIRSSSVLGGTFVYLESGTPSLPLYGADLDLHGRSRTDALSAASGLVASAKRLMDNLNKDEERLRATLLDSEMPDKILEMIESIHEITEHIRSGEGNLGKLLYDDSAYETMQTMFNQFGIIADKSASAIDNFTAAGQIINEAGDGVREAAASIKTAADNLDHTITMAREGTGTLGKLIHDKGLYDELKAAAHDLRSFTERLNETDSTINRLMSDKGALYTSASDAFNSVRQAADSATEITGRVKAGEGTLGKLITDDELYADTAATMKDLREFSASLRTGESTLSRLINDESLYIEVEGTFKDVRGAVNDFREQIPLQSFGSFIFRGL